MLRAAACRHRAWLRRAADATAASSLPGGWLKTLLTTFDKNMTSHTHAYALWMGPHSVEPRNKHPPLQTIAARCTQPQAQDPHVQTPQARFGRFSPAAAAAASLSLQPCTNQLATAYYTHSAAARAPAPARARPAARSLLTFFSQRQRPAPRPGRRARALPVPQQELRLAPGCIKRDAACKIYYHMRPANLRSNRSGASGLGYESGRRARSGAGGVPRAAQLRGV